MLYGADKVYNCAMYPQILLTSSKLHCFTESLLSKAVECLQITLAGVYFYGAPPVDNKIGIFTRVPLARLLLFRRVRKIAKRDYQLCHVCPSVLMNNSASIREIFTKFNIWVFFEILSRKFKVHSHLTRIKGTLREDQYKCLIISHSVLLRMRNVSEKLCTERESKDTLYFK